MLIHPNKCIGCGMCTQACPKKCIEMKTDNRGFLFPVINYERCISCGRCEETCPLLKTIHPIGTKACFAALSREDQIRNISSSGGLFYFLAETVLEQGGVVCGASYSNSFSVTHVIIDSKEKLSALCGSKYSQSRFDQCFNEIKQRLQNKQLVLFVGTPCQTNALSVSLSKEEKQSLLLVDFICHGVPSPLVFQKYLVELSQHYSMNSPVASINMRDKKTGWSKYSYCVTVKFKDGSVYQAPNSKDWYLQGFVNNLYLRQSCEQCQYKGTNRNSDITMGDFWGVWDIVPEMDDNKGTSVVFIHTDKGQCFWKRVKDSFVTCELNEEQAIAQNPSAVLSSKPHVNKELFWDKVSSGQEVTRAIQECLFSGEKKDTLICRISHIMDSLYQKITKKNKE